ELVDFTLQARSFQRAFGDQDQAIRLEWLLDEVVGAEFDRDDRRLDVAVTRNHHDRHVRILPLDRLEQLQPVQLRTLQPDVEQDELRTARLDCRQRLVRIARQTRAMAFVLQNPGDKLADVVFVVDDEDVSSHQDDPIFSFLALAPRWPPPGDGSFISTMAPRPPSERTRPSRRSTPPPWSSKIFTTIGRPSPVPSARVVT